MIAQKKIYMPSTSDHKLEIKLYGTSSYIYEYLKNAIQEYCGDREISCPIEEYHDLDSIINLNVKKIPAVSINGYLMELNGDKVQEFIRDVINKIERDIYQNNYNLFVATDFSPPSYNAVDYALALGAYLSDGLCFVHAYHPGAASVNNRIVITEELERIKKDQLESTLEEVKDSFNKNKSQNISSRFEIGLPADVLIDISKNEVNPMLFIGTKGAGDVMTDLFGSVSRKLARNAHCPVWLIPPETEFKAIKKVLYASNNVKSDIEAIPKLFQITKRIKAELHVVHVEDKSEYSLPTLLEDFTKDHDIIYKEIRNIGIDDSILQYAEEHEIDLISFSNKRRSISEKLFHKSFTRMMYNKSHLPMLIIH